MLHFIVMTLGTLTLLFIVLSMLPFVVGLIVAAIALFCARPDDGHADGGPQRGAANDTPAPQQPGRALEVRSPPPDQRRGGCAAEFIGAGFAILYLLFLLARCS